MLGAINAVTVAFLFGLCVACGMPPVKMYSLVGGELWNTHGGPPMVDEVIREVLQWGLPVGTLWGYMFGSMTDSVRRFPPAIRTASYILVADLAMLVSGAFWPELLPHALVPTTIYAALLARWTFEPPLLPAAVVVTR